MIESDIKKLRDPFILVEDDAYYAYGTDWVCYKNTSGDLHGPWVKLEGELVKRPRDCVKDTWAPEVHKYGGSYYMFTTYFSSKTNHRGCSIFRSASPEGPFVEITAGHATPHSWDSIDATLYIDGDGHPWMVFVHEWTCTDDGIGRMATARLSSTLTHLITKPVELFRADDPAWTDRCVTDGCFMYKTAEGKLLMLWSNFSNEGDYCVAIAESDNGHVDGTWSHQERLLYSKELSGRYEGGHGMIFTDRDGQKYLSIHAPNHPIGDREEKPIFIPVKEENGTLVCL